MKAYSSEAPQYLYDFHYSFEGKNYATGVVAFDEEWARHKFKQKYPNVVDDIECFEHGELII